MFFFFFLNEIFFYKWLTYRIWNESVESSVHTWWRSWSIGMAVLLSERRTCASSSKLIWEKYFGSVIATPVDGKQSIQTLGWCNAGNNMDFYFPCKYNSRWNYLEKTHIDQILRASSPLHHYLNAPQVRDYETENATMCQNLSAAGYFSNCTWLHFSAARYMCEGGGTAGTRKMTSVKVCNNSTDVIVQ